MARQSFPDLFLSFTTGVPSLKSTRIHGFSSGLPRPQTRAPLPRRHRVPRTISGAEEWILLDFLSSSVLHFRRHGFPPLSSKSSPCPVYLVEELLLAERPCRSRREEPEGRLFHLTFPVLDLFHGSFDEQDLPGVDGFFFFFTTSMAGPE